MGLWPIVVVRIGVHSNRNPKFGGLHRSASVVGRWGEESTLAMAELPLLTSWSWRPDGAKDASLTVTLDNGSSVTLPLRQSLQVDIKQPPVGDGGPVTYSFAEPALAFRKAAEQDDPLAWTLRQYASVTPADQNHDGSPYSPLVAPLCLECFTKSVGLACHGLIGHLLPCACSCGAYPVLAPSDPLDERSFEWVAPRGGDRDAWCDSERWACAAACCVGVDDCASRLLSLIAMPTRAAGRYCGQACRRGVCGPLVPSLVRESFSGPPGREVRGARCLIRIEELETRMVEALRLGTYTLHVQNRATMRRLKRCSPI